MTHFSRGVKLLQGTNTKQKRYNIRPASARMAASTGPQSSMGPPAIEAGPGSGINRRRAALPGLRKGSEIGHRGFEPFQIFPPSFLRSNVQRSAEGQHVPQIPNPVR